MLPKTDLSFYWYQTVQNCSPEVMEMIKNDIIKVISKYMVIDGRWFGYSNYDDRTDSDNGSVPALYANIPIKDIRIRLKTPI